MSRPLARTRTDAQLVPRPLEDLIRDVARLFKRRDLSYSQTAYVVKEARKRLGLAPARRAPKNPDVLSWNEAEGIVAAAYRRDSQRDTIASILRPNTARANPIPAQTSASSA